MTCLICLSPLLPCTGPRHLDRDICVIELATRLQRLERLEKWRSDLEDETRHADAQRLNRHRAETVAAVAALELERLRGGPLAPLDRTHFPTKRRA